MLNQLRVGPISGDDGSINTGRASKTGADVTTQGHGTYAEASIRQNIYFSHVIALESVVPHATTVGNVVWNPPGSGVVLSLLKWAGQIEAAAASSNFGASLSYNAQAVIPISTPVVADVYGCTFLNAASPASGKALAYNDCQVAIAQTVVMNLWHATAGHAATSTELIGGDFKGLWTVPPGYAITVLAYVADTDASGLTCTVTWEEIPIV